MLDKLDDGMNWLDENEISRTFFMHSHEFLIHFCVIWNKRFKRNVREMNKLISIRKLYCFSFILKSSGRISIGNIICLPDAYQVIIHLY